MISDETMMTVFEILFIIVGIIGFLASIFNWEWYFSLSRKARFWSDLMGENKYRIFNAVVCALVVFWAISLLMKGI